ncbi:MAG: XrtA system polysaccharide deacetylase [Thermodesulfobacteriota bacterium]
MSISIDNALTIDVEDYFQVHAFSSVIRYQDWANYECRIERNTYRILEILSNPYGFVTPAHHSSLITHHLIKATFFILGWIAERYPGLVRDIAAQGHEVASHGYRHELVSKQTPGEFRSDVSRTKKILEDITGKEVFGYRASTYSITRKTLWALKILAEEGYKYDSSIFPVHHDVYGFPEAPRFPFKVSLNGQPSPKSLLQNPPCPPSKSPLPPFKIPAAPLFKRGVRGDSRGYEGIQGNMGGVKGVGEDFWEFPISTGRLLGQNIPIAGGGYFRLLPYWFARKSLEQINEHEQSPFIFYIHPWEFDPDQPKINGAPLRSRLRHYLNLDKVENRFRKLLSDFNFVPIRDLMDKKPSAPFASLR